jgi:glycine hydroxymethyltransferase
MKEIADSVGAVLMVDMAHSAGLVAGSVTDDEFDLQSLCDIVTPNTQNVARPKRWHKSLQRTSSKRL